jgi:hypothetical protein
MIELFLLTKNIFIRTEAIFFYINFIFTMPPISKNLLEIAAADDQDHLFPLDREVPKEHSPVKKNRLKSVDFASKAELYYVLHASEFTDEEFYSYYMTDEDYIRIEKENLETLKLMKQRQFPASQELYFRGLENSLPQTTRERRQRIRFVVHNVMEEQKRNEDLCPEWIENFRSVFTSKSASFAVQMGTWDFEAMRADLISEVRVMMRMIRLSSKMRSTVFCETMLRNMHTCYYHQSIEYEETTNVF